MQTDHCPGPGGYSKEEIIAHPIFELYYPDCLDAVKKPFQLFAATGEVKDAELQLRRKDGSRIYLSLNVSAVRDVQDRIIYSRSIWPD
ncbi:MAG: PAS domain-containing protein [Proteobacteria bacterium]|nr:PAS domain-containing protein [Pseudomonadota bacterium]MBU4470596.1 PAS domain-containing protein [Pseudomonadota bacterium]